MSSPYPPTLRRRYPKIAPLAHKRDDTAHRKDMHVTDLRDEEFKGTLLHQQRERGREKQTESANVCVEEKPPPGKAPTVIYFGGPEGWGSVIEEDEEDGRMIPLFQMGGGGEGEEEAGNGQDFKAGQEKAAARASQMLMGGSLFPDIHTPAGMSGLGNTGTSRASSGIVGWGTGGGGGGGIHNKSFLATLSPRAKKRGKAFRLRDLPGPLDRYGICMNA